MGKEELIKHLEDRGIDLSNKEIEYDKDLEQNVLLGIVTTEELLQYFEEDNLRTIIKFLELEGEFINEDVYEFTLLEHGSDHSELEDLFVELGYEGEEIQSMDLEYELEQNFLSEIENCMRALVPIKRKK